MDKAIQNQSDLDANVCVKSVLVSPVNACVEFLFDSGTSIISTELYEIVSPTNLNGTNINILNYFEITTLR